MKGFKLFLLGGFAILLFFCCVSSAAAQDADPWQHELTIYGWYAGIDGAVQLPGPFGAGTDITVDASDILDNLEMVFMGNWQSKYNKWSIIADVVYMDVGGSANGVELDLASWVLNGGIGYDVVQADRGTLTLGGGVRYLTLDVDVKAGFQGPGVEKSDSEGLLDGVIGVSGTINFNENWYLPYHADIGTGSSDLTWQLFAGIGYRFSWGDIRLGYRHLSYDLGDDKVMQDLELSGPILGVGFRF